MQKRGQSGGWGSELVAVLVLAVTVTLIVVVILALDYQTSHQGLVVIGGLSGSVASAVAMLIRFGGRRTMDDTLRRYGVVAVFAPLISGFVSGAFSILIVIALFGLDPKSTSLASGAVFGGLYGLLLGGWTSSILAEWTEQGSDERTIIQTALAEIGHGQRVLASQKYNGAVYARFEPAPARGRVAGSLHLMFAPKDRPHPDDARQWVVGPVRVDEGDAPDDVPFDVAIIAPSGFAAYPRTRALQVPATKESDIYDFAIVRDAPLDVAVNTLPAQVGTLPASQAVTAVSQSTSRPTLLIDVSQAARTLQLLEIAIPDRRDQSLPQAMQSAVRADQPTAQP